MSKFPAQDAQKAEKNRTLWNPTLNHAVARLDLRDRDCGVWLLLSKCGWTVLRRKRIWHTAERVLL